MNSTNYGSIKSKDLDDKEYLNNIKIKHIISRIFSGFSFYSILFLIIFSIDLLLVFYLAVHLLLVKNSNINVLNNNNEYLMNRLVILPMYGTVIKLFFVVLSFICQIKNILFHYLTLTYLICYLLFVSINDIFIDKESNFISISINLLNTLPVILTAFEIILLNYHYKTWIEMNMEDSIENGTKKKSIFTFNVILYILRPYFWPHGITNRFRALSTYLALLISKCSNLIAPLYMAQATNSLISNNVHETMISIFLFCILTLLSKLFKELQSFIYLKVKKTAYIELSTFTFSHLHTLSLEWHLNKKIGDVLRSMDRGVESANSVVSYIFLYLFPTIIESFVVLIIFTVHFQLATLSLIGFISLSLYAYITIKITLWRKKFREETVKHDNKYHDKVTDSLINYETIKIFNTEKYEVDNFKKSVEKYQDFSITTQASLSLLNASQAMIIQFTLFIALVVSAPHVIDNNHKMNVGNFIAVSVYLNNLFQPLFFLGSIYNMAIKAYVDMQKLSDLLSVEPDIKDSADAKPLKLTSDNNNDNSAKTFNVEFRNVYFNYPSQSSDHGVLRGVNFVIPSGTTTAVIGETGSGKTTLSRLLLRFYDVSSGRILINNQNISKITQSSLRNEIGLVPQDVVLFNNTIYYNLNYSNLSNDKHLKKENKMELMNKDMILDAAKNAEIYDFIMNPNKCPDHLNTLVGERGLKLSGGEKQRVAIGRVMVKNPSFIILDEATSALDSITEKKINLALNRLKKNRTMLVIAHRLTTILNADQIIVLKNGIIVEQGKHEELLNLRGEYYNYYNTHQKDEKNENIV